MLEIHPLTDENQLLQYLQLMGEFFAFSSFLPVRRLVLLSVEILSN